MHHLQITRLAGADVQPYIPALAALRIHIFKDFPYLYEGDRAYEEKYLKTYSESPSAVIVLVKDGDKVVGASTAIPLRDETKEFKAPFIAANMDINTIFYFGESLLLPAYRGQQIGRRFFAEREAAAREQGCTITAFCSVERPPDHPKRPPNWYPLDAFWKSLGYKKHPELKTTYHWKEVGDDKETSKPMIFWLKQLETAT